ncbi:hypothetical protein ANO11243_049690 [Dothideomycetidae sp. 11243]|nr:hypothetical protein ANO11243_049690 [fungal sp. No.11243]
MSQSTRNPYHNNYSSVITFDAVCIIVTAALLLLRFYVRRYLVGKIGLDDWLLLAANVFFWADCALDAASWCEVRDLGIEDASHVSAKVTQTFLAVGTLADPSQIGAASTQLYILAEVLVRWAYAAFYLRVLPSNLDLKWHRYIIVGLVVLYTMYQTASFFVSLFQCGSPLNFGSSSPEYTCLSSRIMEDLLVTTYSFDAFIDWIMVLLPVLVVSKSNMSKRMRMSVIAILLMGCMASISGILVIALSYVNGPFPADDMHLAIIIDIMAQCETFTAIVCLSLAATRPLFAKYLDLASNQASTQRSLTLVAVESQSKDTRTVALINEIEAGEH